MNSHDIINLISLCFIAIAGLVLWRLNKAEGNNFDIADMFLTDGKADYKKFSWLGSWLACTWMLVYLTYIDKLTEWFFTAYVGTFVLGKLTDKYLDTRADKMPQGVAPDPNVNKKP